MVEVQDLAKSQCEVCKLWFEDEDLDAHLNKHLGDPTGRVGTDQVELKCSTCNIDMDAYYGVPFRLGGTGPIKRVVLGEWAELGEEPVPIDMFVCSQCGRVQLFPREKTRSKLRRMVGTRNRP